MSFTLVQAGANVAGTGSTVLTCAATVQGNLLVATLDAGSGSSAYSAPAGWQLAAPATFITSSRTEIWYYQDNPGGITSATFSNTAGVACRGAITEFSVPAGFTASLDLSAVNSGSAATSFPVTLTPSAGDLLAGGWSQQYTSATAGATWTVPSGFTTDRSSVNTGVIFLAAHQLSAAGGSTTVTAQYSSSANASGWTAVVAAFVQIPVGADTSTTAESATVSAQLPGADTGTAADTAQVGVPGSDTGSGSDAGTVQAALPAADMAAGAEAARVAVFAADSGSGADSASVSAALPGSDTGSGAESAQSGHAGADTWLAAESAQPGVLAADASSGTEAAGVGVPAADTWSGAETSQVGIFAAETWSGAETAQVGPAAADTSTATDAASVLAALPGSDAGSGAESARLAAAVAPSDLAGGSEAASVTAVIPAADRGSGAESAIVSAAVPAADTGAAGESATVAARVAGADAGTAVESAKAVLSFAGTASLAAAAVLVAEGQAEVNPPLLWEFYIAAAVLAAERAQTWRMMRSAAGASGQTGFLYQAAYEAEDAAQRAYEKWRLAFRSVNPGAGG